MPSNEELEELTTSITTTNESPEVDATPAKETARFNSATTTDRVETSIPPPLNHNEGVEITLHTLPPQWKEVWEAEKAELFPNSSNSVQTFNENDPSAILALSRYAGVALKLRSQMPEEVPRVLEPQWEKVIAKVTQAYQEAQA